MPDLLIEVGRSDRFLGGSLNFAPEGVNLGCYGLVLEGDLLVEEHWERLRKLELGLLRFGVFVILEKGLDLLEEVLVPLEVAQRLRKSLQRLDVASNNLKLVAGRRLLLEDRGGAADEASPRVVELSLGHLLGKMSILLANLLGNVLG